MCEQNLIVWGDAIKKKLIFLKIVVFLTRAMQLPNMEEVLNEKEVIKKIIEYFSNAKATRIPSVNDTPPVKEAYHVDIFTKDKLNWSQGPHIVRRKVVRVVLWRKDESTYDKCEE